MLAHVRTYMLVKFSGITFKCSKMTELCPSIPSNQSGCLKTSYVRQPCTKAAECIAQVEQGKLCMDVAIKLQGSIPELQVVPTGQI